MRLKRFILPAVVALAWLYSAAHFAASGVRFALSYFTSDFLAAFPAWRVAHLAGRLDLYRGSLAEQWGPPPIWHYGPILHLITFPLFAFGTLREAFTFWLFVNYVFAAAILVLLTAMLDGWPPRFLPVSFVVILTLNFNPFYEALVIRAIEVFELLLILIALALHRKGRFAAAGALIGLAAMTKFLPLIFLPYFLVKRNWKALGAALAVILPVAVATELVLGWRNSGIFLQLAEGSFLSFEENQSLSGMILRILAWTGSDWSGRLVSRIAIGIALAGLSLLFLRRRNEPGTDLEWSMLLAVMIIIPPHNQNYYLIFLLPGYLLLLFGYWQNRVWSIRSMLAAMSFLVVAVPIPFSLLTTLAGADVHRLHLQAGLGFVGAATLIVVMTMELLDPTFTHSM